MPVPRSKRYESEYTTHYKQFEARRPNTVKGEVTRSLSYSDSNGSTPRAGLQSSKLGTIHEPPLQRKRIVPYEKNHNIFTTFTVKEQPDREWLRSEQESYRFCSPPARRHKEEKNQKEERDTRAINRSETPILAAERKIFREPRGDIHRTVYVPDRIKRKSTYKGDYVNYKKHSKAPGGTRQNGKQKQRPQSPKKVVGGKKEGISPDRLPPAGIRSATSIGDTRLLKPSDDSQYMRSPEREQKVFDSEYSSHFTQPTKFKYVDGLWIETPVNTGATYNVKDEKKTPDWFTQVVERRNQAYGFSQHARGTHFSRENLDAINREQAERASSRSESQRSSSSAEQRKIDRDFRPRPRPRSASPPRMREAWAEERERFPRRSDDRRMSLGTDATSDDDEMVLERGRSPTPELRDTRSSRRHHLDITTNILNDSFEKSLSFSKKKKPSQGVRNGFTTPPKEERDVRPVSPASSVGLGDDARSYTPPRKVERPPPNASGNSTVVSAGGGEGERDDDVLSVSAMSSRASTTSETLERARKRRDEFWKKENTSR